ncbi:MAG TPA: hypothetical protein VMD59_10405 [Acidimicrobiales bacterium]|nr:hypothetical protein [Acidimicrobiales bacterium]
MIRAAVFDWYGTLAEWEPTGSSNYATVLSALGYEPDAGVIGAYHTRWDGVDHRQRSTSREGAPTDDHRARIPARLIRPAT